LFIKYSHHGPRVGKIWYLQAALDFPLHKGQLLQDTLRSQKDKQEYIDKEMTYASVYLHTLVNLFHTHKKLY
jgi:hypothetical protein